MSTTATASGCIPLMSHGPSPTPVNTATNVRQGFIGAFAGPTATGPMSWLSGVMPRYSTTGTYAVDLQVIPLGTPGQGVQAWPGIAVVSRGAGVGPYLVTFNTTTTISLDAADTTNPRWDVVYVQVNDDAIGDGGATNGGFMGVVNGTPASSPVVPSVPTGAIPLAQVYRNTVAGGGNTITASNITDVRTSAGVVGGVRTLLPGDSLSAAGGHNGELTFDTAHGYGMRYWLGSSWHGVATQTVSGAWANGTSDITVGTNSSALTPIMTASVADPGYPYRLRVSAACDTSGWGTFTAGQPPWTLLDTKLTSTTGTTISQARLYPQRADGLASTMIAISPNTTGTLTGPQTVVFCGYGQVSYQVLYASVAAMSTYLNVDVLPV